MKNKRSEMSEASRRKSEHDLRNCLSFIFIQLLLPLTVYTLVCLNLYIAYYLHQSWTCTLLIFLNIQLVAIGKKSSIWLSIGIIHVLWKYYLWYYSLLMCTCCLKYNTNYSYYCFAKTSGTRQTGLAFENYFQFLGAWSKEFEIRILDGDTLTVQWHYS